MAWKAPLIQCYVLKNGCDYSAFKNAQTKTKY